MTVSIFLEIEAALEEAVHHHLPPGSNSTRSSIHPICSQMSWRTWARWTPRATSSWHGSCRKKKKSMMKKMRPTTTTLQLRHHHRCCCRPLLLSPSSLRQSSGSIRSTRSALASSTTRAGGARRPRDPCPSSHRRLPSRGYATPSRPRPGLGPSSAASPTASSPGTLVCACACVV